VATVRFEWDPDKDQENQRKHGVAFTSAQFAFADPGRVIAEDLSHGSGEKRGKAIYERENQIHG
jgi:hypothetical protein